MSPWWRTPVGGSCEMTSPSATESEYSSVVLDLQVVRWRGHVRARAALLPVQSVRWTGARATADDQVDDRVGTLPGALGRGCSDHDAAGQPCRTSAGPTGRRSGATARARPGPGRRSGRAVFGTSYRSLPSDSVNGRPCRRRGPATRGRGPWTTTSPFGTLSEYAAGADRHVEAGLGRACAWQRLWDIPITPGVGCVARRAEPPRTSGQQPLETEGNDEQQRAATPTPERRLCRSDGWAGTLEVVAREVVGSAPGGRRTTPRSPACLPRWNRRLCIGHESSAPARPGRRSA